MPRNPDIKKVLVLGSGPIVIGQGCEFDYSGTQAVKALKEEGCRVVLVNSNPATIMTDPDLADATYVEPLVPEIVEKIVEKERPDACLPTVGGQTAINLAVALAERGTWDRYNVRLLGASLKALRLAEDRLEFQSAMREIGLDVPRGRVCGSLEEAEVAIGEVGLPAVVRPSFTLGGTGSGFAVNREALRAIVSRGLDLSPVSTVLVEESLLGWKEYELEVMRDSADQAVVVCAIENLDPMGVHTGDSVTVAPAMTLTDRELQGMRNDAFAVIRKVGVETGGSNIQFAIHPETRRRVVIEMNPRVSRSSALASKATGFPIAKIAARLSLGYDLAEIPNDITRKTPSSFEPALDYVVVKIPRWNFEKFPGSPTTLSTEMRSVGEVMAIGRTFREAVQKGLRSLELDLDGFNRWGVGGDGDEVSIEAIRAALTESGPERLLIIAEAFRRGLPLDEVTRLTSVEPWFCDQIRIAMRTEAAIRGSTLESTSKEQLTLAKREGFSDAALAEMVGSTETEVRRTRHLLGVRPVFWRIDTCAGEFESFTPYLYSTYETRCEADPSDGRKILILGGGPIRIGQGIEFDACACEAAMALREGGIESILMNCNPETVSTDYDTSDRLYFEPLTLENVLEVVTREKPEGVILQFGGQTPLRLARALEDEGVAVLGTSADSIDLAEDRQRFGQLMAELGIPVPKNGVARTIDEAIDLADRIGYPLIIRPSYVLGGRAMIICYDESRLREALDRSAVFDTQHPLFLDRFLEGAIEFDVDALCDGSSVWIAGIQQHVEMAGIHSGDSAAAIPAREIPPESLAAIRESTEKLGVRLAAVGLLNIQFALHEGRVYVLEANPRASRTVPYVSKAIGLPLARLATRLLLGEKVADLDLPEVAQPPRSFIKMPVFPFRRFPQTDPVLGPEMRSTGEVLGIGPDFGMAYAKACMASGIELPQGGTVFLSVHDRDKEGAFGVAKDLVGLGFSLLATSGTADALRAHGLVCERVFKVNEGHPNVVDRLRAAEVQLVVNTPLGKASYYDEKAIRSGSLECGVACITTIEGAREVVAAIRAMRGSHIEVESLQEIHGKHESPEAIQDEKKRAGKASVQLASRRSLQKGETDRSSAGHQGGT